MHEIFFQVFDKGWMEDGEGRFIDFKNTLILLTTNAGTELIASLCKDPDLMPDPNMATALREPLLKVFPPALLGRLVVIPYYPLNDEMLGRIVRLQLGASSAGREQLQDPVQVDDAGGRWSPAAAPRTSRRPHDRRHPHQHHAPTSAASSCSASHRRWPT